VSEPISTSLQTYVVVYGDNPETQYHGLLIDRGLRHEATASWESEEKLDALLSKYDGATIWETWSKKTHEALLDLPDSNAILHVVRAGSGNVQVEASATDLATARSLVKAVREVLPKSGKRTDAITVRFWHDTVNGPKSAARRLVAPTWNSIQDNYTAHTARYLSPLMTDFRPAHGGQVILWHGPAGTGKTWALRSLCKQWEDWATFEYVLDPERLFGESAGYLLNFLLGEESDEPDDGKEPRWRLVILEDTGELISQDAKERTGQGLSRLLNVTDGFVGQGLRVLVLITTNEKLERLHPAISRPGRAASVVLFDCFDAVEASRWLRNHGASEVGGHTATSTLADLYAQVEEFAPRPKAPSSVGFRPPTHKGFLIDLDGNPVEIPA